MRRVLSSVYRHAVAQHSAPAARCLPFRSVLRCPMLTGILVKSLEGQPLSR